MREIKFRAWDKTDGVMWQWIALEQDGFKIINDPSYILMQYTGLKDKNGKEIYEGDLLQLITFEGGGGISAFPVEFENGCFGICTNGEYLAELKYYIDMPFISAVIIGNIHENPELIKEAKHE